MFVLRQHRKRKFHENHPWSSKSRTRICLTRETHIRLRYKQGSFFVSKTLGHYTLNLLTFFTLRSYVVALLSCPLGGSVGLDIALLSRSVLSVCFVSDNSCPRLQFRCNWISPSVLRTATFPFPLWGPFQALPWNMVECSS